MSRPPATKKIGSPGGEEGVPPIFEQIYAQNAEMIRHYDRLKYAAWTVYIAIIAGLYVASSQKDIGVNDMLAVTCIASLYFIMLLFRIQRNYKVFYTSITHIERYIQRQTGTDEPAYGRLFPFLDVDDLNSDDFHRINIFDKIFGSVPYFWMKVGFFILTPAVLIVLYMSQPVPAAKSPPPPSAIGTKGAAPAASSERRPLSRPAAESQQSEPSQERKRDSN